MTFDLVLLALLMITVVGLVLANRRASANGGPDLIINGHTEPRGWFGRRIGRLARQAGLRPASIYGLYWPAKILLAMILPSLLGEWTSTVRASWQYILLAVVGFFLPDLWLLVRRSIRRDEIQRSLSYFLDLIVAFLLSGLSLEEAVRRAGANGFPKRHPLGEELRLVGREMASGKDRAQAFAALAERTAVRDLDKVAAALQMGLRLGTPIRVTLESQADLLRVKRREDGLRRINRAMVSAIFPVVLCGIPIFLVLVFFPTMIQLLDALGAVRGTLR